MTPTDEDYAELTTAILGLVSHRSDWNGKDIREGFDMIMEGIDDEAIELTKAWVEKHCTTTLDTVEYPPGTALMADNAELIQLSEQNPPPPEWFNEPFAGRVCTCHERDGSFVCEYCQAQGLKGHMQ